MTVMSSNQNHDVLQLLEELPCVRQRYAAYRTHSITRTGYVWYKDMFQEAESWWLLQHIDSFDLLELLWIGNQTMHRGAAVNLVGPCWVLCLPGSPA